MLIRLAITAVILAILAGGIDMGESARAMATIDLRYLALVLVLVAIDRAVMILRWILLLRSSGNTIASGGAARLFLVSSSVGSFLPAGVGADAARAYGLTRERTSGSEALASVAVDRVLGVMSIMLMAAVGVAAWPPARDPRFMGLLLALLASCGVFFTSDVWIRTVIRREFHAHPIATRVFRLSDALGRYRDRRGVLIHVMLWSVVVQVLRITQAYYLGVGLGMTVPYAYYLLFMPIGLLVLLLPISIGGFGVPQGVIVWLLQPRGVPEAEAFALSTLIVLTGMAGNLPGMWLWLRQRREIL